MSFNQNARLAGFLYMIAAFPMAFTELYVRSKLIVWGDIITTASNIINNKSLYTIGFVSDVIGITFFVFVPLVLYRLLKAINKDWAILMVVLALISVPIMAVNMINHAAVLEILSNASYMKVFESDQLYALGMLSIEAHGTGYLIAQIFFGLWLLPFGGLVCKSGFLPKILGVLLMIASIGYLIQFVVFFLLPSYGSIINPIVNAVVGIGELGIMFWLMFMGVNDKMYEKKIMEVR